MRDTRPSTAASAAARTDATIAELDRRRAPDTSSDDDGPRGLVAICQRETSQAGFSGVNAVRASAVMCLEVRAELQGGRAYRIEWIGLPYVGTGTGISIIDMWLTYAIGGDAPTTTGPTLAVGKIIAPDGGNGVPISLSQVYQPATSRTLRALGCWGGREPARGYGWLAGPEYPSQLSVTDVGPAVAAQNTIF